MTDFIKGFNYVLGGFKLIIQPGIRLFVIIPLLINTLLFASVIVYGAHFLSELINWMIGQWSWFEWLTWLLWPFFVVISLTIVFFCFTILANLIGAPFNGFLAEAVENRISGNKDQMETSKTGMMLASLPTVLVTAIKSEARKFLYFFIRAIPLLLLFIIPLVNVAAPLLWILFGAWMLALEYIDYPMGNHDINFPEQRNIIRKKRSLAFGFGVGVMVLTLIPVINFIAMPVAVSAATRMVLEQLETENPPPN